MAHILHLYMNPMGRVFSVFYGIFMNKWVSCLMLALMQTGFVGSCEAASVGDLAIKVSGRVEPVCQVVNPPSMDAIDISSTGFVELNINFSCNHPYRASVLSLGGGMVHQKIITNGNFDLSVPYEVSASFPFDSLGGGAVSGCSSTMMHSGVAAACESLADHLKTSISQVAKIIIKWQGKKYLLSGMYADVIRIYFKSDI